MFLPSLLTLSLLILTATSAPTSFCTADTRRRGLRSLIQAFIHGVDDAGFATIPLADNVTSIIQIQGARFILGRDRPGARRAISFVNQITTDFGPAPNDLSSYLDNGVDMSFVNGTADVGVGALGLKIVRAPATQNLLYDVSICEAYEAVGTVEPVNGLTQEVLRLLVLQNFPLAEVLDVVG